MEGFAQRLEKTYGQVEVLAKQMMEQLMQWVHQQPIENIYVAIGGIIISSIILIFFSNLTRLKSNKIVLAGLSGSGKTSLFYQLRDGTTHQGTVTSMEPNEDTFVLHSESEKSGKVKPVHVVDVPGHPRLRSKLDDHLSRAAALVFVVDALDFLPNCRAASEYLYDILTKESVVKSKIPILIACNKTDKVTAHSKEFIRKQLEKEIEKLRSSRTAISSADIKDEYTLGVPGETFAFHQCVNKVSIAELSCVNNEISQVEEFIREHVKA